MSTFIYTYVNNCPVYPGVLDEGSAKKSAFHRACENAFCQLALVVLPEGKVAAVVIQSEGQAQDIVTTA